MPSIHKARLPNCHTQDRGSKKKDRVPGHCDTDAEERVQSQ